MDFLRDTTTEGRPYRVWAVVDDFTRENPGLLADRWAAWQDVAGRERTWQGVAGRGRTWQDVAGRGKA
jgi:hypothetical protein